MTNTVTVGCKYPSGVLMQVGSVEIKANGSNSSEIYGGHGITEDVPEDFWKAWLEQNKNHSLVTGGFIFAHEKRSEVKAEAKEKSKNKTKAESLEKPEDNIVS
jgi:hypothetical protein